MYFCESYFVFDMYCFNVRYLYIRSAYNWGYVSVFVTFGFLFLMSHPTW